MRALPVCAAILLIPSLGVAQNGPPAMITDRPDQTESAAIVPQRTAQLEMGASFVRLDALTVPGTGASLSQSSWTIGSTLVRIGVHPRVEARIGFAGYERVAEGGVELASGVGDLDLGAKVQLIDGPGTVPQVALIGAVVLPTAADQLGVEEVSGVIRLAFAHELTGRLGLGWNIGAAVERGTSTETEVLYTAVLGVAAAERIGLFIESFGFIGASELRADRHLLDAGATFLMIPNVQLDASGGIGLNSAAEDWFAGVGLSVRVPR